MTARANTSNAGMTRSSRLLGRHFVAFALALCFLLQSAARAGSGCLPSVFNARCCCESAEFQAFGSIASPASAEHAGAPHRSCCASQPTALNSKSTRPNGHSTQEPGQRIRQPGGCQCELAPLPNPPSDMGTSWVRERARDTRASALIARGSIAFDFVGTFQVRLTGSPPPLSSPPGSRRKLCATSTATRLAQRGVIGLLSDLGTFLE